RDIRHATHGFNLFVLAELLGERDKIDGTPALRELHHAQVNAAVRVEREIVGAEKLCSLRVGRIIEQNGAENGPLSFYAGRQSAVESVIGSGHLPQKRSSDAASIHGAGLQASHPHHLSIPSGVEQAFRPAASNTKNFRALAPEVTA